MSYTLDEIATTLRTAREQKGLSQRELSKRAGVPQSHISKIEGGAVDLRISSLLELARALDLEMVLVSRKAVPAIKSISRKLAASNNHPAETSRLASEARSAQREISRLKRTINSAIVQYPNAKDLDHLKRQAEEIQQLKDALREPEAIRHIREATKTIRNLQSQYGLNSTMVISDSIKQATRELESLRKHAISTPKIERPRSAYSLEDDSND